MTMHGSEVTNCWMDHGYGWMAQNGSIRTGMKGNQTIAMEKLKNLMSRVYFSIVVNIVIKENGMMQTMKAILQEALFVNIITNKKCVNW